MSMFGRTALLCLAAGASLLPATSARAGDDGWYADSQLMGGCSLSDVGPGGMTQMAIEQGSRVTADDIRDPATGQIIATTLTIQPEGMVMKYYRYRWLCVEARAKRLAAEAAAEKSIADKYK